MPSTIGFTMDIKKESSPQVPLDGSTATFELKKLQEPSPMASWRCLCLEYSGSYSL